METQGAEAIAGWLQPLIKLDGPAWPLLLLLGCGLLLLWLTQGLRKRIWSALERGVLSNWRLALLGAAALVLSMASGWTTWEGMRNFTHEPLLSAMVTFGIQGVMLIAAWLIGESFATGMHTRSGRHALGLGGVIGGMVLGFAIVGGVAALAASGSLPITADQMLFAGVALSVILLIGILQGDLVQPYLQGAKIIVRNALLWVMFLACMATSVFFAFDSRFTAIFPKEERERASELRAQNQVSGILADIGRTISERRQAEVEALFRSEAWAAYESQLDQLARKGQDAQSAIEAYFVQQMEARRREIAEQQERRASAESQQAGLQARSIQLNEELSRIGAERPSIVTAVIEQQQVVSDVERRLDEQRAKVLAEEKGVEGSGKAGRGEMWRAEKATLERIAAELQVAKERLRAPQTRLSEIDKRMASIKAELSQIEGSLAQLKGEAATAEQRITAAERATNAEGSVLEVDPARVLPAFERAKAAFRQEPTVERLGELQQQCAQLLGALASAPATREEVRSIDCDPKQAAEAAAMLFALNAGAKVFAENCVGGEKLDQHESADQLFGFARSCLADSRLPSESTNELRDRISFAELNRDDKAHNFVVSWNAFRDGNRLAYLALANAIAIDLLVLMTGLFGANALRSPLQDVPSYKPRSAKQLEAIIENALVPDPYETARAVIEAMQPITPVDGFTQEVILDETEAADRASVLKVLNAAATIDAVVQDAAVPGRYLVRPELFEFLSIVARKHYEGNEEHRRLAELKQLVSVALEPHPGEQAAIFLHNLHPINEKDGFSSEVLLNEVSEIHKPIVRRTLNAAAALRYAVQDTRLDERDRFYIHKDLYKMIAKIAAANPVTVLPNKPSRAIRNGGALSATPARVSDDPPTYSLTYAHGRTHQDGDGGGNDAALSAEEAAHLYRHYKSRLLNAMGVDDVALVQDLRSADSVYLAAVDAWKALKRHSDRNERLSALIEGYQSQRNAELSEEYSRIHREIGGDVLRTDILDRADKDVSELVPMLMLLPEIGLLSHIIDKLEDSAAYDDGLTAEEQALLDRLRAVNELLDDLDLAEAENWQKVEDVLRSPDPHATDFLNAQRRRERGSDLT